ncbi:MAG: DUF423 domain-containing protein [Verrucomicrobiota bacterium]
MSKQRLIKIVGILGVLGIGLGAFGAHGLKETLEEAGMTTVWENAVLYHLIHMAALFALSFSDSTLKQKVYSIVAWAWIVGILLFSGSLYAMSLTQLKFLGPITPLGGLSFMVGWVTLVFAKAKG